MNFNKLKVIQYAEQKGEEIGFPIGYAEGIKIAHQIALYLMYEPGFSEGKNEGKNISCKEGLVYAVIILIYKKMRFLSPDIIDAINTLSEPELKVLIFELAGETNTIDVLNKFIK